MTKSAKLIAAALALVAVLCLVLILRPAKTVERPVARITLNGTLVNEIDLSSSSQPKTLTYEGVGGFSNVIRAEQGRICVESAGCPDQVCVDQGWISDGTTPIVCLPNKLVIEIVGGDEGFDAATG